jgi:hypothetical protein
MVRSSVAALLCVAIMALQQPRRMRELPITRVGHTRHPMLNLNFIHRPRRGGFERKVLVTSNYLVATPESLGWRGRPIRRRAAENVGDSSKPQLQHSQSGINIGCRIRRPALEFAR